METRGHIYDVIVIGAGASGMMAAGRAAERGKRVLLLERNGRVGAKLAITGGGRCNITNAEPDQHKLLAHYGDTAKFLYSPFSQFGVADTRSFFEKCGLPLVEEARKRVFPETQRALDVVRVMERYCRESGVKIRTGVRVTGIARDGASVVGVRAGKEIIPAKAVVLATGGVSHPETGSTGDGFSWLTELGHTIQQPTPTIVPLSVGEQWVKELSGTSLSFMKISFSLDGKRQFSKTGKLLFTHFGISGPLILNSATQVAGLLAAGMVTAEIDAYPDTELGALDARVMSIFDANKNKELRNVLPEVVPHGTMPAIPFLLPALDLTKRVHSVTKEERKQLVHLLKALPLTITGLMGFDRAVVADGGVPLTEIDPRTFASQKYENLYITGDLLHINRPSGGFSLQLCWTSGYVAGSAV